MVPRRFMAGSGQSSALSTIELERIEVARIGNGVADVDAIRSADRQRQGGEERLVCVINLDGGVTVGRGDALQELGVQGLSVLADDAAGQLGKLVVAQDQVHSVGVLALECRDDIQELVRSVSAVVG